MRCPTKHGPYRCMHSASHSGDCEALDLTGIPLVAGRRLDELGDAFGVRRNGDADDVYRIRIWRKASA